ncbi:alpha/beta hydrolase [Paludibacterium denitrificans]|uniref:alpha/beta hydrolase n=1 Tax=Paludibacterium denitrificans TaxID=2675226 RepID=UPI001E5CAA57|nr:hypothetical protein [Paludibacterium denitrificans]
MYQHGMYNPEFYELRSMLFSSDAGDDVIEAMIQHFQPESDRAIMDMAFVNLLGIRPIPPLPALVLGGGEDALIPAEDVQATAQLLNVRAEILPNMGHMMMMDTRWQQVAECLLRWLEGLNIGAENSSHHRDAVAAPGLSIRPVEVGRKPSFSANLCGSLQSNKHQISTLLFVCSRTNQKPRQPYSYRGFCQYRVQD